MNDERPPLSVEEEAETGQSDGQAGTAVPASAPSVVAEAPSPADEAPATVEAAETQTTAAGTGGDLEELVLPSLVSAPEPLPPETHFGPEGRLRVVEHVGTRGRINRYAAIWRGDD